MLKRRAAPLLLSGLLLSAWVAGAGEGAAPAAADRDPTRRWSDTRPAIDLVHLFRGEINRRGRPVGFHARPGGIDPDGSGVVRRIDPPDRNGVYTARVWIARRGLTKVSSFYPDRLSRALVVRAILHAYHRGRRRGERFRGPSGHGFTIEGYAGSGRIRTAYPLYRR